MYNSNFTDQIDWERYWSKQHEVNPYTQVFFEKYLKYFPNRGSLIELGGFPGKFAGYFKKRFDYDVTILDSIIIPERVRNIERLYNLEEGSIKTIKADVNNYKNSVCFDIVTSFGFIEHFEDTKLLVKQHVDLLKPGGVILATIPNFKGINGFVQKHFDPKNYSMHNIKSMDTKLLREILKELNLNYYEVSFIGRPTIWLEPDAPVKALARKSLLLLSKVLSKFPFRDNRLLAPHIILVGVK